MKMSKRMMMLACLATLAMQGNAFAEDYYVPIKKELEPMARVPMPAFSINNNKMVYTLPRDIAGKDLKVELNRNVGLSTEAARVYEGGLATATCMGDDVLPACVIKHKNLGINPDEVHKFLESKYVDPKRLADAKEVSKAFISGNEPIGFISKRSIPPQKAVPAKWSAELLRQGDGTSLLPDVSGELQFSGDVGGALLVNGKSFDVSDVSRDAQHIRGVMNCCGNADSKRWFDVFVSTDKASFEGTWGRFDSNGKALPAAGVIRAKELK